MEKYLGVKLIKASEEMSRQEYCDYRGWELPENENGDDRVYLVEYEKDENSKQNHPDHEGYISMSPKDVFDKAYRKIKSCNDFIKMDEFVDEFKQRVVFEAKELETKCVKLNTFLEINNIEITHDEQIRLKQQLMAMQYYLTILIERIENFK